MNIEKIGFSCHSSFFLYTLKLFIYYPKNHPLTLFVDFIHIVEWLEAAPCDPGPCAEWTSWEEWSSCSVTCGQNGRRNRMRTCLGGVSGVDCPGS